MPCRLTLLVVALAERPGRLGPGVGLVDADDPGQVESRHRWRRARRGHCRIGSGLAHHLAARQGDDAAVLGAMGAKDARQPARVDAGDADRVLLAQVVAQGRRAAEVRGQRRHVLHDKAGGMDAGRFHVFRVRAVAADVRIRQGDDLPAIARVGQDLLIAGERGVENDLARGLALGADRCAVKDRAVGKCQEGLGVVGQQLR